MANASKLESAIPCPRTFHWCSRAPHPREFVVVNRETDEEDRCVSDESEAQAIASRAHPGCEFALATFRDTHGVTPRGTPDAVVVAVVRRATDDQLAVVGVVFASHCTEVCATFDPRKWPGLRDALPRDDRYVAAGLVRPAGRINPETIRSTTDAQLRRSPVVLEGPHVDLRARRARRAPGPCPTSYHRCDARAGRASPERGDFAVVDLASGGSCSVVAEVATEAEAIRLVSQKFSSCTFALTTTSRVTDRALPRGADPVVIAICRPLDGQADETGDRPCQVGNRYVVLGYVTARAPSDACVPFDVDRWPDVRDALVYDHRVGN